MNKRAYSVALMAGACLPVAAVAGLVAWGDSASAQGEVAFTERCASLAGNGREDLVISTASLQLAGPAPAPPGAPSAHLPAHCLVKGTINPRTGVGGREFGIGFELRLPEDWSGRFMFQGGGGLDGVIGAAIGTVANSSAQPALTRGFAVVSTDAGHQGSPIDATFGLDQQARVDYAYNAIGEVTALSKSLIAQLYGQGPGHSYFIGCSNGGRQGLIAAQRFPLEFDGIVAGDPAMSFSRLGLGQVWNLKVLADISPRDAQGRPILSRAFSDNDLQLVRTSVLDQCDALDGLADGMINDWQSCGYSPEVLACSGAKTDSCLSAEQVDALEELKAGPRSSSGEYLYGPFTYDTGIASPAWRGIRMGSGDDGEMTAGDATLGLGMFRYLQLTPPDPDWDPLAPYDIDDLLARIRHQGGIGDADSPFLSTFALHGKMIVYNGMSDQGMSTPHIVRWYEDMVAATGEPGREAVRFFGVPGMLHCGGGEATDQFEMLDAIVDWVEQDKAPDRVVATGNAFPGVSRPLCPYPKVARYDGGDPDDAASFSCRE